MGPINYDVQVQSPFAAALQGYQAGAGIRDDQQKQQQYQAAQQQAIAQRETQSRVLNDLISKPNASAADYANASLLVPGLKDQFKQAFEMRSVEQQQSQLRNMGQAWAATANGRPDLAAEQLNTQADAMEKAGVPKPEVEALRNQAKIIQAHPEFARATIGMQLAALPGGDKFISGAATMGKEQREAGMYSTELRKGKAEAALTEAKAGITAVEAANAPTRVGLENANIESTIQDRAAGQRIAELNVQIGQANSETQRGQLVMERDKLVAAQAKEKAAAGTAAQDQVDTINSSLASVQALAKHPSIDSMVGTFRGQIASRITGSDRNDIEALVETVKSQQFLTGIKSMQGMGALSNAEGDKIGSAVASLNLNQSAPAFKNALGVIRTTLEKAQAKAVASGKLPESGGAFLLKVPGVGNVTDGDVNRIMQKNPGSTREQVLQYLQSRAGKAPGGATGGF